MIKGLLGMCGIKVSAGDTSVPYIYPNTTNPMTGMVRVWGTDTQVFDGTNWLNMNSSYATVSLDPESQVLLDWARRKMLEEQELQSLMEKHPGLKDAKDRFEFMLALVKEHKDQGLT
tara:strand:- start:13 stop:363 length:351 start_codon:yes stop_codon:yes gene_type:complete